MTKLLAKLTLTLFPILLLLLFYVVTDPFEVIFTYDNHYADPNLLPNRDFISVDTLKTKSKSLKYDSFVLGNSRSLAFTCSDWGNYINSDGCFHLDASGESLYGIYTKMEWLNERKFKINNILIILDVDTLSIVENSQGHIFEKHPDTIKEGMFPFHLTNIKAFLDPSFLIAYADYKVAGKIRPRFSSYFEKRQFTFDRTNNDVLFKCEKEISEGTYYDDKKDVFYTRGTQAKYSDPKIKSTQKQMLRHIKQILDSNKSTYKIIVSPLYDQLKTNDSDISELRSIFGQANVFDYSGINKYTNDINNYYEPNHYRRLVGKMIFEEIYDPNNFVY